jgi:hypothetical protein
VVSALFKSEGQVAKHHRGHRMIFAEGGGHLSHRFTSGGDLFRIARIVP